MRRLLPLLFCLAVASLWAQEQEPHLLNRLLDGPDKKFANNLADKKFEGSGSVNLRPAQEQKDSYSGLKKFDGGNTFATRSFLGIKNPWFGNKVYEVKGDSWSKKQLSDNAKTFQTEDARVKKFAQSDKALYDAKEAVPVKEATIKGSAQGSVSMMKKDLTIDEVREILNKNH